MDLHTRRPGRLLALQNAAPAAGCATWPSRMTPVYDKKARISPCLLRFQFSCRGRLGRRRRAGGRVAAAICLFGLPVEAAILPALPMMLVQALFLERSYAGGRTASG
jgi:hypothetical protein